MASECRLGCPCRAYTGDVAAALHAAMELCWQVGNRPIGDDPPVFEAYVRLTVTFARIAPEDVMDEVLGR